MNADALHVSKTVKLVLIVFSLLVLSACGGGGGNQYEEVDINYALRCGISASGLFILASGYTAPENCMSEDIVDLEYQTDQSLIHLAGRSFRPLSDNCPPPTIWGPPCVPTMPASYTVSWTNLTNGASSFGTATLIDFGFVEGPPVGWSSYDFISPSSTNAPDPRGIPLDLGVNKIRVSASDRQTSEIPLYGGQLYGESTITITRVDDVSPPTIQSTDPAPDGTFSFRIRVYFREQLDPASVTSSVLVIDEEGVPAPGLTEFDSKRLIVVWRPEPALNPDTPYTALIMGVSDLAGNVMVNPFEWSFRTRP